MKRVGDDDSGFSVEVDVPARAVQVTGWGFWGVDVAGAFLPAVSSVWQGSVGLTHLVMDMARLKPLRDEGQEAVGALFASLTALGVRRASVSTGSHLTKLQLLRIAKEHAPKNVVEFVSTAAGTAGRTEGGGTHVGSR